MKVEKGHCRQRHSFTCFKEDPFLIDPFWSTNYQQWEVYSFINNNLPKKNSFINNKSRTDFCFIFFEDQKIQGRKGCCNREVTVGFSLSNLLSITHWIYMRMEICSNKIWYYASLHYLKQEDISMTNNLIDFLLTPWSSNNHHPLVTRKTSDSRLKWFFANKRSCF